MRIYGDCVVVCLLKITARNTKHSNTQKNSLIKYLLRGNFRRLFALAARTSAYQISTSSTSTCPTSKKHFFFEKKIVKFLTHINAKFVLSLILIPPFLPFDGWMADMKSFPFACLHLFKLLKPKDEKGKILSNTCLRFHNVIVSQ